MNGSVPYELRWDCNERVNFRFTRWFAMTPRVTYDRAGGQNAMAL
jgi:hypothetical protein